MPTLTTPAGNSAAMLALEEEAWCAARFDGRVLLSGESGVGKQTIARVIHQRSRRANAPFVVVDCATTLDTFEPAWLASHTAGATLFLRGVDTLNVRLQSALFRYLDSHVGRDGAVRVIAASCGALFDAVSNGAFREDLFYRLNSMHLYVPPLRERPRDVPVLLDELIRIAAEARSCARPTLTADTLSELTSYSWPGNVRELRQLAEHLVVNHPGALVDANMLRVTMLPETIASGPRVRPISADVRVLRAMRARRAAGFRLIE